MNKTLTSDQIASLLAYDKNMSQRLEASSGKPIFTKEQTIQILNAVTELKTLTDDGEWKIKYSDNGKRFFVSPGPKHRGKSNVLPCGSYITEWALGRLQL